MNKEKSEFKADYSSLKHKYNYFYEDENYIVKDSCRGEFGGAVEFRNKHTKKVYVTEATCPSSLIKINQKYYLTTSLAHMGGRSEIHEITDPTELTELKASDTEREKYFKKKYDVGLKKLYEGGGTILVTFLYNNELFFITSEDDGTYLKKRNKAELIKIKKILDKKVFTYESEIKVTSDNTFSNKFQFYKKNEFGLGIFEVKENIIKINLYE